MQEVLKDNHILTINDVAAILRCSKTHVSHVLAGKMTAADLMKKVDEAGGHFSVATVQGGMLWFSKIR